MFKNLRSHIFVAALFAGFLLGSAGQASAYAIYTCVGGRLYTTTVNAAGHLETRGPGGACSGGQIAFFAVPKSGGRDLTPGTTPIEKSEAGRKFLASVKDLSPKDLKPIAASDNINSEILERALDPKIEKVSYKPGDLPPFLEKLFAQDTSQVAFSILVYVARAPVCSPGFGLCYFRDDTLQTGRRATNTPTAKAVGIYDKDKITLFFPAGLPPSRQNMGFLPVDADVTLSDEDAQAMGAKSVTILKGNYRISLTGNKDAVTVNLRMK